MIMRNNAIVPDSVIDDGLVGVFSGSIQIHVVHLVGYTAGAELTPYMIADGCMMSKFGIKEFQYVTVHGLAVPQLIKYAGRPSAWACLFAADVYDDVFLLRGVAAPAEPGRPLEWQLN